jgi:hypothetical protein
MFSHFTYKHVGELEIDLIRSEGATDLTPGNIQNIIENVRQTRADFAGESSGVIIHSEPPLKELEVFKSIVADVDYEFKYKLLDDRAYHAYIRLDLPKIFLEVVTTASMILGHQYAGGLFLTRMIPFFYSLEIESFNILVGDAVV